MHACNKNKINLFKDQIKQKGNTWVHLLVPYFLLGMCLRHILKKSVHLPKHSLLFSEEKIKTQIGVLGKLNKDLENQNKMM